MTGYLLDTNVASEARKGPRTDPNVQAWLESANDGELYLSVLALGEIRKGIEQARSRDPIKARALERWIAKLETIFADRILPVTAEIAERWGRLGAVRPIAAIDGLLAATALVHELVFVTRNVSDVAHTGVDVLNPFEAS